MTLYPVGGDEDGGVVGPKGFTAARGGSNGTSVALLEARAMSFMRSQKQTAASLVPLQANGRPHNANVRSEQSFFLQRTLYRRPRLHPLKIGRQRNGERKAILASPHEHYEQVSISNTKTGSQR
jgi:hypothetical protein